MITEWWAALSPFMQVMWGIALASSVVFIIQSIMTFVGVDFDAGVDTDFSADAPTDIDGGGSGINILTFRNFINFCLGFGWTAVLLNEQVKSVTTLMILAFLVGAAMVVAVMFLFKWLTGMQQSGTIDLYKSAAGCQGTVYLTIPANHKGTGKVQISINGSIREYDAVTDGDSLRTGAAIQVIEVINDSTLLVGDADSQII